jgi:hypothetical protein
MGASTTTSAARDEARVQRPAMSSRVLRVALQLVLGTAGFAGFALLGAGGAWLFKHYLAGSPSSAAPSARVAPAARAQPAPAPPAALPAVPPVAAIATPPAASAAPPQEATPVAALPQHAPTLDAPPAAGRPTVHAPARPARHLDPPVPATAARADRAACLARVNAITADLSLRNEPPTPEQLAILKRGCK